MLNLGTVIWLLLILYKQLHCKILNVIEKMQMCLISLHDKLFQ